MAIESRACPKCGTVNPRANQFCSGCGKAVAPQAVKGYTPVRASHLNTGTGIPEDELSWPESSDRVARLARLNAEVAERSAVTPFGRLALAAAKAGS